MKKKKIDDGLDESELEFVKKNKRSIRKEVQKAWHEINEGGRQAILSYRPKCFGIDEQTRICEACRWKLECSCKKLLNDLEGDGIA